MPEMPEFKVINIFAEDHIKAGNKKIVPHGVRKLEANQDIEICAISDLMIVDCTIGFDTSIDFQLTLKREERKWTLKDFSPLSSVVDTCSGKEETTNPPVEVSVGPDGQ